MCNKFLNPAFYVAILNAVPLFWRVKVAGIRSKKDKLTNFGF